MAERVPQMSKSSSDLVRQNCRKSLQIAGARSDYAGSMPSNIEKSKQLVEEARALREAFRRAKQLRAVVQAHALGNRLAIAVPAVTKQTVARIGECQVALTRLGWKVETSSSRYGFKVVCTQGADCFVCLGSEPMQVWQSRAQVRCRTRGGTHPSWLPAGFFGFDLAHPSRLSAREKPPGC
jgi:hypothetical protein